MTRRGERPSPVVALDRYVPSGLKPADLKKTAVFQLALFQIISAGGNEASVLRNAGDLVRNTFRPHTFFLALSQDDQPSRFHLVKESRLKPEQLKTATGFLDRLLTSGVETITPHFFDSFDFLSGLRPVLTKSPVESEVQILILMYGACGSYARLADRLLPMLEELLRFRIENLRLRTDVERRVSALTGLHKSAAGLSKQLLKVTDLLQAVSEEARRTLNIAAAAVLMPIDENRTTFAAQARSGFTTDVLPLSDAVLAKALEDFELTGSKAVIYPGRDNGTSLLVPLTARGKPAKLLLFHENRPGVPFFAESVQVAEIFADWVSIALDNALMFERVSTSQREWENTFDSISDPIYIVDQDFHMRKMNRALAALAMRSIKLDSEPTCYKHLFHRSTMCPWCPVPRSLQSDTPVSVETPLFAGGIWQIQSFPLTDKAGRRVGSINVLSDLTVLKRMQEQLIESEKLASIGKLISGVAHEVRNPLFGISTTARALSNHLGNKEDIKPFLDIITSETARLNRLMEDLLNYSRTVKIDKDASRIEGIISEVIERVKSSPEGEHVEFNVFVSDLVPSVNVDRNKIHQVLFNLFENSAQHSNGPVKIDVFVELMSLSDPPEMHLVIKDNGSGIPLEQLPKIFDPFYTTRQRGTGLGLSIVRKVIHDHGGRIAVESRVGVGTTFRISLPIKAKTP